jgi:hypothetical protein
LHHFALFQSITHERRERLHYFVPKPRDFYALPHDFGAISNEEHRHRAYMGKAGRAFTFVVFLQTIAPDPVLPSINKLSAVHDKGKQRCIVSC